MLMKILLETPSWPTKVRFLGCVQSWTRKEEKIRSEMAAKVTAVEEELRLWKETAISREKQLELQRDLFAAQLTSKPSGDGDVKSQDDIVRDMASQISKRIDSIKTFEELTRAQLRRATYSPYSKL
ncbi:hypothetical protein COOONC_08266 [Cooperia oncophora]